MKKAALILALVSCAVCGECQSAPPDEGSVRKFEADSVKTLKQKEAAYPAFRAEAMADIRANAKMIKTLRKHYTRPHHTPAEDSIKAKIDDLARRNSDLHDRLSVYERELPDWVIFRAKFTKDKEQLHSDCQGYCDEMRREK